jgi:hypothetical protein
VEIVILPGAGSDFLADNFTVTPSSATGVPEPAGLAIVAIVILAFARVRNRL